MSFAGIKLLFARPMQNKSDPFRALRVILVSFHRFDPFGVCDNDTDALLFQNIEHRHPVFSAGFHTNIQTVIFVEPVGKAELNVEECFFW